LSSKLRPVSLLIAYNRNGKANIPIIQQLHRYFASKQQCDWTEGSF